MATLQETVKSNKFKALSPEAQGIVLDRISKGKFKALSPEAQNIILQPPEAIKLQPSLRLTPEETAVTPEFAGRPAEIRALTPEVAARSLDVRPRGVPVSGREQLSRTVIRPALVAGGAALGTVVGLPLAPATLGTAPIAGGALGFAGGKVAADLFDRLTGIKRPPETLLQAIEETGEALKGGFEQEAAGVVFPAAIKGLTKFPSFLLGGGKRLAGTVSKKGIEIADRLGVSLTAVERTGSKALALWEALLNKFPFSAETMQKHHQLRQAAQLLKVRDDLLIKGKGTKNIEQVGTRIQSLVDDVIKKSNLDKSNQLNAIRNTILKKIGTSETFGNLGINFKEAIKQKSIEKFARSKELFSKVSEVIPKDAQIPTENLTKVAQEQLKKFSKLNPSLRSKFSGLISVLDDFSKGNIDRGIQKSLSKMPPAAREQILQKLQISEGVNFETLQLTREILNDFIRGADEAIALGQPGVKFLAKKGTAGGVFKQLKRALDEDLLDFSNKSGGEIAERFQAALSFHGKTRQQFSSKIVKRILKSENPANIVDMIVRPNNVTDIKLLKEIAGKENVSNIKKGFTNLIFDLKNDEVFNPQKVANLFRRYGDEVLSEVYSPKELRDLKDIVTKGIDINNLPVTNSFFKTITRTKPEKIVDIIVRPENTKNIIDIRKIVGKEGMEDIRAEFLKKQLELNKFERFSPAKFSTSISKFGERTLKELFKGKEGILKDLLDLKEVSLLAGGAERIAGNPSGTAQTVISYSLAGSMSLWNPALAAKVIVLPKVLARIYLSKGGTKLLSEGVKLGINTKQGLAVAGRIISIVKQNKEEKQQQQFLRRAREITGGARP